MKAISLWQPWASLIAIGAKPFETRSWAPPKALIGQRIAIHAAKKPLGDAVDDVSDDTLKVMRAHLENAGESLYGLPRGVIVCTAVLYSAVESTGGPAPDVFGDYSAGRWIWSLTDVTPLRKPLPWTGRQGFFEVELDRVEESR